MKIHPATMACAVFFLPLTAALIGLYAYVDRGWHEEVMRTAQNEIAHTARHIDYYLTENPEPSADRITLQSLIANPHIHAHVIGAETGSRVPNDDPYWRARAEAVRDSLTHFFIQATPDSITVRIIDGVLVATNGPSGSHASVLLTWDVENIAAGLKPARMTLLLVLIGFGVIAEVLIALVTIFAIKSTQDRSREGRRSDQLMAADKLATVGSMAASVAHEINNPLTTINVLIHNLAEGMPAEAPERMDLQIALDEIAKIKNTILRFMEFARPQEPELTRVDINELVRRYHQLARQQTSARQLEFVENLRDPIPPINADPAQIGQALLNILLNAIDATPAGGRVELSTNYDHDGHVTVTIFNSGLELRPELAEKIFEPFYSTKAHGTGLGLSIVKMIMDFHRGEVTAAAVPGRGTAFTLVFPVSS